MASLSSMSCPDVHKKLTKGEMIAELSKGASSPPPDCLLDCTQEEIELVYALHHQAISSSDNSLGRAEELERISSNLMGMEGRDVKELKVDNIIKKKEEKENPYPRALADVSSHWAVGGDDGINLNSTVKLWGLTGNGASLNGSLGTVQKLGAERLTIKVDGSEGRIARVKIDNLILVDDDSGQVELGPAPVEEKEKEGPDSYQPQLGMKKKLI